VSKGLDNVRGMNEWRDLWMGAPSRYAVTEDGSGLSRDVPGLNGGDHGWEGVEGGHHVVPP